MPSYISSLDGNYISLKRAAALIAREQSDIAADEVMETFTHALFAREFEREEIAIKGMMPAEDWNLPLLRMEAPPEDWPSALRLPINHGPQEYFAVEALTIADVLGLRNALPGRQDFLSALTFFRLDSRTQEDTLNTLAHIPYAVFPPKAKAILGGIMMSKIKLRAWMVSRGYPLPAFLRDVAPPGDQRTVAPAKVSRARAPRGRRRKAGWPRIEELIREAHAESPETPRKKLAIDARIRAAAEYPSKALPSGKTIVRQMKSIVENHPPRLSREE